MNLPEIKLKGIDTMIDERKPEVSLIIPAKNEGENVKTTIESALSIKTELSLEIVVIDDGSTDGCCDFLENHNGKIPIRYSRTAGIGAARARNLGTEMANGDYFIFCDAHLFFEDWWVDRLIKPIKKGIGDAVNPGIGDVKNPDHVGYGYSWTEDLVPRWNQKPHSIVESPHLAGGCMAISRVAFKDVGGFDDGFRVWGREDEEISLKLWLFGYTCLVEPEVKVLHVFRHEAPPFLLTWDDVNFNTLRMAYSHFNEERIERCRGLIKYSDINYIEDLVIKSGALEQRKYYLNKRKYSDEWFMVKFGIHF